MTLYRNEFKQNRFVMLAALYKDSVHYIPEEITYYMPLYIFPREAT